MEPIKKLFQSEFFSKLQEKKQLVDTYEKKMKKKVPASLQNAVKVTNVIDNVVVVEVSNNTIAHQLKLIKTQIIKEFKSNKYPIFDLKVKINPNKNKHIINRSNYPIKGRVQLKKLEKKLESSPLKKKLTKILKND